MTLQPVENRSYLVPRLVNLLMVCVWLISQTLVVSHSQAHTVVDHQRHMTIAGHNAADSSSHQHHQSDKQHSHEDMMASSDDGAPAKSPHSMDECCDIACQSANVVSSSELMVPHETLAAFRFAVRSVSCWSPGFVTPPPNPAA